MKRLIPILLAVTTGAALIPSQGDAAIATGRILVTVNITIVTPIPSGDEVACDANATGSDSLSVHTEVAFMVATAVSASLYQCVFSIPYEWQLTTPTTVGVTVHGGAGYLPLGSTSLTGISRSSDHIFTAEYNLSTSPTAISQIIDLRL